MLELAQVVPHITAMGMEARRRTNRVATLMETALRQASLGQDAWAEATAKRPAKSPWQAAGCDEPPAVVYPLPYAAPAVYTALATDGSQIPLDRHAVAPCYLLNMGEIALHYGTGERPRLTSQATLHYKDEDIYQTAGEDGSVVISEKVVATRRLLAESAALASLIAENSERHSVALVDDPLILVFADQREKAEDQREVVNEFCEMLKAAQGARTPVAGYISRPGARDVVGALRLTLCPGDCPHDADSPCGELAHLSDVQLFAHLLPQPGDRSPVFRSEARSLVLYPEEQRIVFFYLNVGPEIARIEIPQWAADDPPMLDRVHVLCYDQAGKGQGYPVALAEAHERAIVRGPERDAFFQLVQSAFVRENLPALQTRKALAKRTRVL